MSFRLEVPPSSPLVQVSFYAKQASLYCVPFHMYTICTRILFTFFFFFFRFPRCLSSWHFNAQLSLTLLVRVKRVGNNTKSACTAAQVRNLKHNSEKMVIDAGPPYVSAKLDHCPQSVHSMSCRLVNMSPR
jgi:hypothetical protein